MGLRNDSVSCSNPIGWARSLLLRCRVFTWAELRVALQCFFPYVVNRCLMNGNCGSDALNEIEKLLQTITSSLWARITWRNRIRRSRWYEASSINIAPFCKICMHKVSNINGFLPLTAEEFLVSVVIQFNDGAMSVEVKISKYCSILGESGHLRLQPSKTFWACPIK